MSWSIGYDEHWERDVGYGVPAICDHPGCTEAINRGLGYVCGGDPYGGDHGCGLFFCSKHRRFHTFRDGCDKEVCIRCDTYRPPYPAKPDTPEWINWKLTDESWETWRIENAEAVAKLKATHPTVGAVDVTR